MSETPKISYMVVCKIGNDSYESTVNAMSPREACITAVKWDFGYDFVQLRQDIIIKGLESLGITDTQKTLYRIAKRGYNLSIGDIVLLAKHAFNNKIDIFNFSDWLYDIDTKYAIRMLIDTNEWRTGVIVIAAVPSFARDKIDEVMSGEDLNDLDIEVELF
jgi:hypothetical protein